MLIVLNPFKEALYGFFYKNCAAENRHNFIDISVKIESSLYNRNQAIGADCGIYLDPNRCFGMSPKGFDAEMLFYPFEEKFGLYDKIVHFCGVNPLICQYCA